jgi:hypothetical protein
LNGSAVTVFPATISQENVEEETQGRDNEA